MTIIILDKTATYLCYTWSNVNRCAIVMRFFKKRNGNDRRHLSAEQILQKVPEHL